MREELAPHVPPTQEPVGGPFAPGWLGRLMERLVAVLVAAGLFYILCTQTGPRKRAPMPAVASTPSAQPASAGKTRGNLVMELPEGVDPAAMRVSVLIGGTYAAPEKDQLMRLLPPADLALAPLPPGEYVVVISYREQVLPGIPVKVEGRKPTAVPIPREELTRIEYETAVARQAEGQNADVEHLRRVVALDPDHIDAHLQLAAHALANGDAGEARQHLAVVERQDPGNPHAIRIRRVLARLRAG